MATPDFPADKVPKNLKVLRDRLGLTQTDVARLVGMNQQTWSKYESGDLRLRVDMLPAVARALQCLPIEILSELEDRQLTLAGAVVQSGAVTPLDRVDWSGPAVVECPREMDPKGTDAFVVIGDALLPMEPGAR